MAELNPEQWAEVKRLFLRVEELRPEQRFEFLQRECPDENLRRQVTSLPEYSGEELTAADRGSCVRGSVRVGARARSGRTRH